MPSIRNPFETLSFLPKKKLGNPVEDNLGRLGRLKFDPWSSEASSETDEEQGYPKRDWSGYLNELKEIYSKEGPAQSAYRSHLQDLPEQQNPSVWGRIVAGIVGAGTGYAEGPAKGIAAGQSVVRRPYERALEEWQNKEAGLSRQAEIEEKNLGRRLGYMKEVREVEEAKALEEAKAEERELKRQAQEDLARYRDAQIKELDGRGWITLPPNAQGETIMANPRTGEQKNFGKALAGRAQDERERAAKVTEGQGASRVSQGWANVNLGQAAGQRAERGLGLEERRTAVAEDAERRRAEAAAGGKPEPYIPVPQQEKAKEMAISRALAAKPHWEKFVDPTTNQLNPLRPVSGWLGGGVASEKDKEDYAEFEKRVQEEEDKILGRRRKSVSGLTGAPPVAGPRFIREK